MKTKFWLYHFCCLWIDFSCFCCLVHPQRSQELLIFYRSANNLNLNLIGKFMWCHYHNTECTISYRMHRSVTAVIPALLSRLYSLVESSCPTCGLWAACGPSADFKWLTRFLKAFPICVSKLKFATDFGLTLGYFNTNLVPTMH